MIELLDQKERAILANWVQHEGYKIFVNKILGDTCQEFTNRVVRCDPTEDKKIIVLQNQARAINQFCEQLIKSLNWQVLEGIAQADFQKSEQGEKK